MRFSVILSLAVIACVLISSLESKSLGKHKKHGKKHHVSVKHQKKAQTPPQAPDSQADDAAAGAGDAAGGSEAGADDAEQGAAPAPTTGGDDADSEASPAATPQQQNPNDLNGNGVDDAAEQANTDANGDGIDDRLQQQQAAPAPEEEEGSASEHSQAQSAKAPMLLGGHMRPGPPAEPLYPVEARYCDAPCPQTCAPACYDWCCFPSIPAPTQPVQLMMVPVNNVPAPAQPPTPGPLQYPMNYMAPLDASCALLPCSAKKNNVETKHNETTSTRMLDSTSHKEVLLNTTQELHVFKKNVTRIEPTIIDNHTAKLKTYVTSDKKHKILTTL